MLLENNCIYIYLEEGSTSQTSPVDEFDLCPPNGEVSVHSAVTAVELNNTAASDLPYILRLEFEPNTTCWPGRCVTFGNGADRKDPVCCNHLLGQL